MRTISTLMITAALGLGCLPAGSLESQTAQAGKREETPPAVRLRIDGRDARGSGELQVSADPAAKGPDLTLVSEKQQRAEIRGSGPLLASAGVRERLSQQTLRLRYEQRVEPGGTRVFVALVPLSDQGPALLVHLDLGGRQPVRQEILPGLTLSQRDEPDAKPDVDGAAARRTWLAVEVNGAEPSMTLEGGETATISYRGAAYRLHVYRSLRRDPGTNPQLPFEGERYMLTATLTPVP